MQFIKLLDMHFTFNDSLSFQTYFHGIDLYILEDIIFKKKSNVEYMSMNKEISVFRDFYSARNIYNVTFAERVC